MWSHRRRLSLAGQLFGVQLVLLAFVLLSVGGVAVAETAALSRQTQQRRVESIAEGLADRSVVRNDPTGPRRSTGLSTVAQSAADQSGAGLVVIADATGRIVATTDPTVLGGRLGYGDDRVRHGVSWSGELTVGGVGYMVAQVPVIDAVPPGVGDQLGTVMVGAELRTLADRLSGISRTVPLYAALAALLGAVGSWLLARHLKRQTLGLEPQEIAALAQQREAVLHGITEGVLATGEDGRVTFVNDAARQLLDLPADVVGRTPQELRLSPRLVDVLGGATAARDQVVLRRGRILVLNRAAVASADGRAMGSVTTLRDRTELDTMASELGGYRSSAELLRAQAHEFANRLHTISGLIQIGATEEVVDYVEALNAHRQALDLGITRRVQDRALAALLMAKTSQANERRVRLNLSEDTSVSRLTPADSADVALVLGNLIDNAVDAAAAGGARSGEEETLGWVEATIRHGGQLVEIEVRDSGPGVAPDLATEVFSHGFTTKAAGHGERGIGLALTRSVCRRHGGDVSLDSLDQGRPGAGGTDPCRLRPTGPRLRGDRGGAHRRRGTGPGP